MSFLYRLQNSLASRERVEAYVSYLQELRLPLALLLARCSVS
jgi:hypothetical protein